MSPGPAAAIGLEVHCQLTGLKSKLFCPCRADYRGMAPNTNVCPVCVGLPGTLPRPNRRAVEKALQVAAALGCSTPPRLAFFRKCYFYPDLPKNFQITQLDAYGPSSAGSGGRVRSAGREVGVRRVQLEEDPGRLVYEGGRMSRGALADYNRAGVPLVEIVTEPDFAEPGEARRFLAMLAGLLRSLGSDPSLEGALRADGNVSVGGGSRVEVKNVASFHDLEKALRYEITRQRSMAARGIPVAPETRHWDEARRVTAPSRGKEEDMDYRYHPEGDIPQIEVGRDELAALAAAMPEAPPAKRERYESAAGVSPQVAEVLSSDAYCSALFDEASAGADPGDAREMANLITTDLMGLVDTAEKRKASKLTAPRIAELARAVRSGAVTRASARGALREMVRAGGGLAGTAAGRGGAVAGEEEVARAVESVMRDEPGAAAAARADPKAVNYIVGRVMAATGGRADPGTAVRLVREGLARGA